MEGALSAVNAESVFLMDMGDLDAGMFLIVVLEAGDLINMFLFEAGDLINILLIVVLEAGDLINILLIVVLEAGDLINIAPILAATAAIY